MTPGHPQPRFFLRDAVAILPDNGRDLTARLARAVGLAQGLDLDLEITLDARFFGENKASLLQTIRGATSEFKRVVYHLHSGEEFLLGNNLHTRQLVEYCLEQIATGKLQGVCVHPDLVDDFEALKPLALPGSYLATEVLDEKCSSFNTLAEIRKLLDEHDWLDLVLDTAHIAGMVPEGEPALPAYCEEFAGRVVEVHISQMGNHYDPRKMGPDFDTNHSLLTLGARPLAENLGPLRELGGVNLVIEGVIPAGDFGRKLLEDEARSFRNFFQ